MLCSRAGRQWAIAGCAVAAGSIGQQQQPRTTVKRPRRVVQTAGTATTTLPLSEPPLTAVRDAPAARECDMAAERARIPGRCCAAVRAVLCRASDARLRGIGFRLRGGDQMSGRGAGGGQSVLLWPRAASKTERIDSRIQLSTCRQAMQHAYWPRHNARLAKQHLRHTAARAVAQATTHTWWHIQTHNKGSEPARVAALRLTNNPSTSGECNAHARARVPCSAEVPAAC